MWLLEANKASNQSCTRAPLAMVLNHLLPLSLYLFLWTPAKSQLVFAFTSSSFLFLFFPLAYESKLVLLFTLAC
jgi:hypothetical protein